MEVRGDLSSNVENKESFTTLYEHVELERVVNIKFLGVIINNRLDWSNQINKVVRSLTSLSGVLYNLRKFVSEDSNLSKSIYFALVNSVMSYAISVWGSGGVINALKPLHIAQKSAFEFFLIYLMLVNIAKVTPNQHV